MEPSVAEIERAAFDAWPAAEVVREGGWRLRFAHGVTQRGNSVWPGPGPSELTTEARIANAEAFYRERGRPCLFAISPSGTPPGLDADLERRGYEARSPVDVQIASAHDVGARSASREDRAVCEETPSPAWLELATTRGRYTGASRSVFEALLGRLDGRAGFALAQGPSGPAATGLAVVAPPWAGIFAMRTLDDQRGQGLGRAVLAALASWALARDAERLYLQVEQDNPAALALYARAGFTTHYAYHYRRRESDPRRVIEN